MNIVIYLAGATCALFGFVFFADNTGEYPSFVYLQYTCILLCFFMLIMAISTYTSSRPKKLTKKEEQAARIEAWHKMKSDRRSKRRYL